MPPPDLRARGARTMTVCNSCRYCEQYCPVFPAMERRLTFASGDLAFLANLCHNCGECLYACEYAPPHEFGIDVPRTLAELRLQSYEECCWPRRLGAAFRRQGTTTAVALASGFTGLLFSLTWWINPAALSAGRLAPRSARPSGSRSTPEFSSPEAAKGRGSPTSRSRRRPMANRFRNCSGRCGSRAA